MRGLTRGLILGALLVAAGWSAASARAQEDWGLTRQRPAGPTREPRRSTPRSTPAQPRSQAPRPAADALEPLTRHLGRRPNDEAAWARLQHLWVRREGSVEAAVDTLEQRLADAAEAGAVARVVLARLLESQRRLQEAEAQLAAARQGGLEAPALALRHAALLRQLERASDARALLSKVAAAAEASREQRVEALRSLAELDLASGDVEAARARHAKLRALSGPGSFAAAGFARALSDAGRHGLAADEYARLARQRRGDARASAPLWRDAARERLRADDAARAAQHARRGLSAAKRGAPGLQREILSLLIETARLAGELETLAPELEREAGRDPELTLLAAGVWRDLGRPERAEALYRKAIRLAPRDGEARLALAQLLSSTGRLEAAVEEYEALVRSAPDQPELIVELAELLERLGRADRARQVVARAGRRHPRSVRLHRALAELYLRWELRERALAELELLTRIDPDDPGHWIALGTQRLQAGDEEGARRAWQQLLKLGGDEADRHATLARVLADHDQLAEAIEQMQRARRTRPEDVGLLRDYASMLERASRLREAEAAWQQVLNSSQADAAALREARQHLVVIWKRSGRLRRRIASLEGRFDDPDPDLEAGRTLAEALARSGPQGLAQAAEVLETLVAHDEDDVESLRALARVHGQLGHSDRALDVLERLAELDVAGAQGHLRRAVEIALESYQDERALRLAERAVRMFPGSAESHALLGELYLRQQRLELAAASFRECLRLEPDRHAIAMALGALEMRRGSTQAAREVYLRVLRATRDDALAGRAASALFQIHVAEQRLEELERAILPLALSRTDRPLYRRLLVDTYGAWLGPAARRVRAGQGKPGEVELLREVGKRAIRPLLEALTDPDPAQRQAALTLLGPMGHPGAVSALLALAREGEGGSERAEAIVALALLRAPQSLAGLEALAKGPSARLRPLATWALARVGGEAAARSLRRLLESRDRGVRVFAALGLGHLGLGSSAQALTEMHATSVHAEVRAAALHALTALQAPPPYDALAADLSGPVPLAEAAAFALLRSPEVLASALFARPPPLQRTLVRVLASESLPVLEHLPVPGWPSEPARYLRRLAEITLDGGGQSELPRAIVALDSSLRAALAEGGNATRAAMALLGAGDSGGVLWELAGEAPEGCAEARAALESLIEGATPVLLAVWRGGEPALRDEALQLLARAGGAEADPVLARVLAGGSAALRHTILRGLRGRELQGVLRETVERVASDGADWSARRLAVVVLGPPRTLGQLRALEGRLAHESSALVRAALLEQLSAAHLPGAREALRAATRDPEAAVAERATALLAAGSAAGVVPADPGGACLPAN